MMKITQSKQLKLKSMTKLLLGLSTANLITHYIILYYDHSYCSRVSCQYSVNRELEKQIYHHTATVCKSQSAFIQAIKWPEKTEGS